MKTIPHEDALRARWQLEVTIPLASVAENAAWVRARSIATGDRVVLFIVHGAAALETADAARRAYLVEDPHLLPVREVVVLDDPRDADTIVRPARAPGAGEPSHAGADPAAETDSPAGGAQDAGAQEPTTVVEYPMPPAPPLAALLTDGPMRAETARSVIGEAALGIEAARRRGLRHQFLDSNRLFVDSASGSVTLLGLGVEAASHPELDRSGAVASFQDATALVALLYRALTGKSPRRGEDGEVPRASAVSVRTVPADLDLLCDLVLNDRDEEVPETSRALIAELEPWQSIPVTLQAHDPDDARLAADQLGAAGTADETADPGADSAPTVMHPAAVDEPTAATPAVDEPTAAMPVVADDPPEADAPVSDATGTDDAGIADAAVTDSSIAAETAETDAAAAAEAETSSEDEASTGAAAGAGAAAAEAAGASTAGAAAAAREAREAQNSADANALVNELHLAEKRSTSPFPGHLDVTRPEPPQAEPAQPEPTSAESAPTGLAPTQPTHAEPTPPPGTPVGPGTAAQPPAASPPPTPSGPVPVLVRGRQEPVAPGDGPIVVRGRDRSAIDPATPSAASASRASLLRDVVGVATDSDESEESFALGPQEPEERSRQAQWILLGAGLLVIIAMVFALTSITSGLRDRVANPLDTTPPTSSPSDLSSPPKEKPTPKPSDTPEAAAPQIAKLELLSGGSDVDHPEQLGAMSDGDPGTFWSTKMYSSPDFGRLKQGIGVRVDLEQKSKVNSVIVTTARNTGGTLEARAVNPDGSLGEVLASGQFAGDGEARLDLPKPVEATSVAVWVPQLPPDSKQPGKFRARIAEIRVE